MQNHPLFKYKTKTPIAVSRYGKSFLGQPLTALSMGNGKKKILITSGIHGDEVEGVILGSLLWSHLYKIAQTHDCNLNWIPIYNPDGFSLGQRCSANAVDLNRNFPTQQWNPKATDRRYPPGAKPASEPETRGFIKFAKNIKPSLVIELHSFSKSALLLDFPASNKKLETITQNWAKELKIPALRGGLGYNEFGCAYQWFNALGIPSITLEIKKDLPRSKIQKLYLTPTLKFLMRFLNEK